MKRHTNDTRLRAHLSQRCGPTLMKVHAPFVVEHDLVKQPRICVVSDFGSQSDHFHLCLVQAGTSEQWCHCQETSPWVRQWLQLLLKLCLFKSNIKACLSFFLSHISKTTCPNSENVYVKRGNGLIYCWRTYRNHVLPFLGWYQAFT